MTQYDALIIGGGHNGLVAAATLAKAGRKVIVLEKRTVLGGAAATEELFPGFHVNTGAADRFDVGEVERLTEICAGRFAWTDTPRQFHRRRW